MLLTIGFITIWIFKCIFNYSSLLIHSSFSLKKGFVNFDYLFITIGFITNWILRCIIKIPDIVAIRIRLPDTDPINIQ